MTPALLTAVDSTDHVHLIVGSNSLAGSRCSKSVEVGAKAKLVSPENTSMHYGLVKRIDVGEIEWIKTNFQDQYLTSVGRTEVNCVVDAVFVTLPPSDPLRKSIHCHFLIIDTNSFIGSHISHACRRLRIPINVVDSPSLSTFTLLTTHLDGPLQIGITTSGKGCKLASRIKREVAASLPPNLGSAVARLGDLRRKLSEEDNKFVHAIEDDLEGEDEESGQPASFNQLVTPEDITASRSRRMRWMAQICEYWPLKRLAAISDQDVETILTSYRSSGPTTGSLEPNSAELDARIATKSKGIIILAGSGPGSPELLTLATLSAIKAADIILADKLVPAPILDLIPRRTPVHIARKFPGNADAAQDELLEMGLAALKQNRVVLRLKQGDPYLFGRGGEEVLWFRQRNFEPVVLPGITSSLSAPLFANIPVTMRNVADQVLICTGTGRKGKMPAMPEYMESRTVVFLMALHRLSDLVSILTCQSESCDLVSRSLWPVDTPCTIVERASCRDQRVIRSTLRHVCAAVEELGSRPPGLLVLGRACGALTSLDRRWVVEEGFGGLQDLGGLGFENLTIPV
jgi:uroporphyrin-III C-methyltransferase